MGKGRVCLLPKDQQEFLRSYERQFDTHQAAQTLHNFWPLMTREWFQRWPVEPGLGLEVANTGGVSIELSNLPEEQQVAVGKAQTTIKGVSLGTAQ